MYLLMGVRVELVLMLYVTFILATPTEEQKAQKTITATNFFDLITISPKKQIHLK
jgi:hypothetical protein